MNPTKKYPIAAFLLLLFATIKIGVQVSKEYPPLQKSTLEFSSKKPALQTRQNITFILGEDHNSKNPYYSSAYNYYRQFSTNSYEFLVTTCRSLLEVRNLLEAKPTANQLPWGKINLVVHANEWTGLGVPTIPGGRRTNTASLRSAIENGDFQPLAATIVDGETEIVIQGCALGKNQTILEALSQAFCNSSSDCPIIRSSKYFIQYGLSEGLEPAYHLMDARYAFYPTGYRPNDIQLSQQLSQRYPDVSINWRSALATTSSSEIGTAYHYTLDVPVVWIVTYPDIASRPKLDTPMSRQDWLDAQAELLAVIEKVGIPRENFHWTFRKIDHEFEDDTKEPAIKVIGLCTVLCVLQTLVAPSVEDSTQLVAVLPALQDTLYYAVEKF